jgi:hypothetical protein
MTAKFDFGALERPFERDWPVTAQVPLDGGGFEPQTFMARFRMLSETEVKDIIARPGFELADFARAYFIGLGKGETAEFSPEIRERMLERVHVREGLDTAYKEFTSGGAAKN